MSYEACEEVTKNLVLLDPNNKVYKRRTIHEICHGMQGQGLECWIFGLLVLPMLQYAVFRPSVLLDMIFKHHLVVPEDMEVPEQAFLNSCQHVHCTAGQNSSV